MEAEVITGNFPYNLPSSRTSHAFFFSLAVGLFKLHSWVDFCLKIRSEPAARFQTEKLNCEIIFQWTA